MSRFLPGVRAIVPPVAGALGVGPLRAAVAMGVPSGLWYGAITYAAFTAGGDFEALTSATWSKSRRFVAHSLCLTVTTSVRQCLHQVYVDSNSTDIECVY